MGLFDSKSVSSSTSSDSRVVADGGSLVATNGGTLQITNVATAEEAFELSRSTISGAFKALGKANTQADNLARIALGQAGAAQQSDIKEFVDKIGPLALIVFGVVAWRMVRK